MDIDDFSSKEPCYILVEIPDYNPGTPGYLRYLLLGAQNLFAPGLLFLKNLLYLCNWLTSYMIMLCVLHLLYYTLISTSSYPHTCYITYRGRLLEEGKTHLYKILAKETALQPRVNTKIQSCHLYSSCQLFPSIRYCIPTTVYSLNQTIYSRVLL